MNITSTIIDGMTPQEKETYFKHMEKRHKEEDERNQAEKDKLLVYKEMLILDILKSQSSLSYERLKKKSIRVLEKMSC